MKLTTSTQVSVDGVMQGPGAPVAGVAERGAFERDGWAHFDTEAGTVMDEIYQRAASKSCRFGMESRGLLASAGSFCGP